MPCWLRCGRHWSPTYKLTHYGFENNLIAMKTWSCDSINGTQQWFFRLSFDEIYLPKKLHCLFTCANCSHDLYDTRIFWLPPNNPYRALFYRTRACFELSFLIDDTHKFVYILEFSKGILHPTGLPYVLPMSHDVTKGFPLRQPNGSFRLFLFQRMSP